MKKMIQKLIKKIKDHKLFLKFSCLTVACLLLFYMTSVSVFAAEGDEAAAQSQETESITDVWTAVMDGIMDLINAAHGVFYSSSGSIELVYSDVVYDTSLGQLYSFSGFSGQIGDIFNVSIFADGDTIPGRIEIFGPDFSGLNLPGVSFSMIAVTYNSDGSLGEPFAFYDIVIGSSSYPGWTTFLPSDLASIFVFEGSFTLTFLGTLAVLGVAIAVIMLLVYVVVSFIRLRG